VHRTGGRGPRRARQVHFTSPPMVGLSHARITVTSNNVLTKYINVLFLFLRGFVHQIVMTQGDMRQDCLGSFTSDKKKERRESPCKKGT
jgi:hypothetical protein